MPAESIDPPDLPPTETGSLSELLRKSRRGAAYTYRPGATGGIMHLVRFAFGQWRETLDKTKNSEIRIERFYKGEEGKWLLRISHGVDEAGIQYALGLGIIVPPKVEHAALGRPVRVQAVTRSDSSYHSRARLGMSYRTRGRGNSGWLWFAVPKEWSIVEFTWLAPNQTGERSTINLLPGPQGTRGIDICQVTLSIGAPA